jgi:protein SCO1/2
VVDDPQLRRPPVDRAAAFAHGAGKIPRRTVILFIACLLAVGSGGIVLDHFFGGPTGSPAASTPSGNYPPPLATTPHSGSGPPAPASRQLPASQTALMGLQRLGPSPAPNFTLKDQSGAALSLTALRGKVVILTFFDSTCDDICPVLAAELSLARRELGSDSSGVAWVVVNTDPLALTSTRGAESAMAPLPGAAWYFATGTLDQLNSVWKAYGIAIQVTRATNVVTHNDALYFIDAAGRLWLRATPYADESRAGTYSLAPATEREWGLGIAAQAQLLLAGPA